MLATHSNLIARLDAELERDHGIPLSSYEVLMYLADAEGERLRMGELADRLLLSRSGITRLVDRLERQGMIERRRCEDDGRGFFAVLTPAGRRKLDAARPDHLAGVRDAFPRPSATERARLAGRGLGALSAKPSSQTWTKRPADARYAAAHDCRSHHPRDIHHRPREGRRAHRARAARSSPTARRSPSSATTAGSR